MHEHGEPFQKHRSHNNRHTKPDLLQNRRLGFPQWGKTGEFQAEPWGPKLTYKLSFEEQSKSMNLEKFKENIEYIRKTKYSRVYLWGGEWMYWAKKNNYDNSIWEEAKKIFK